MINPVPQGTIKTVVKAEDSITAANKLYAKMSSHFAGNLENFQFTIQEFENKKDLGKGKISDYSHYSVSELRGSKNTNAVKVNLEPIKVNKKDVIDIQKNFKNVVNEIKKSTKNKMKGGSQYDDIYDDDADLFDDEDSDEEWLYDIHRHANFRKQHPISNFFYYPWSYRRVITSNYINVPTFKLNIQPYIRLMPPFAFVVP